MYVHDSSSQSSVIGQIDGVDCKLTCELTRYVGGSAESRLVNFIGSIAPFIGWCCRMGSRSGEAALTSSKNESINNTHSPLQPPLPTLPSTAPTITHLEQHLLAWGTRDSILWKAKRAKSQRSFFGKSNNIKNKLTVIYRYRASIGKRKI